jgi:hypothetical protein
MHTHHAVSADAGIVLPFSLLCISASSAHATCASGQSARDVHCSLPLSLHIHEHEVIRTWRQPQLTTLHVSRFGMSLPGPLRLTKVGTCLELYISLKHSSIVQAPSKRKHQMVPRQEILR